MNDLSDEAIDALLRRDFEGPVADDGFSLRVMHALPTRKRRPTWLLPLALAGGGALAWAALTPSSLWLEVAREGATGSPGPATVLFLVVMLGTGLVGCAWALEESA
jgi:hypothetical protein